MYFPDLTPYAYGRGVDYCTIDSFSLNVGWLDSAHPFPTGGVPAGFIERLERLARYPVMLMRGDHVCEFCDFGPSPVHVDWESYMAAQGVMYKRAVAAHALSSAEIRAVGRDGKIYASPLMICHYVEKHHYRPPQAFIEAVMEMPLDQPPNAGLSDQSRICD